MKGDEGYRMSKEMCASIGAVADSGGRLVVEASFTKLLSIIWQEVSMHAWILLISRFFSQVSIQGADVFRCQISRSSFDWLALQTHATTLGIRFPLDTISSPSSPVLHESESCHIQLIRIIG